MHLVPVPRPTYLDLATTRTSTVLYWCECCEGQKSGAGPGYSAAYQGPNGRNLPGSERIPPGTSSFQIQGTRVTPHLSGPRNTRTRTSWCSTSTQPLHPLRHFFNPIVKLPHFPP